MLCSPLSLAKRQLSGTIDLELGKCLHTIISMVLLKASCNQKVCHMRGFLIGYLAAGLFGCATASKPEKGCLYASQLFANGTRIENVKDKISTQECKNGKWEHSTLEPAKEGCLQSGVTHGSGPKFALGTLAIFNDGLKACIKEKNGRYVWTYPTMEYRADLTQPAN